MGWMKTFVQLFALAFKSIHGFGSIVCSEGSLTVNLSSFTQWNKLVS